MENPVEETNNEQTITSKQKFEGKVLKTSLQGALVDIGSEIPAFLHISQVVDPNDSEKAVTNIEDVLKADQVITVWVKRVQKDRTPCRDGSRRRAGSRRRSARRRWRRARRPSCRSAGRSMPARRHLHRSWPLGASCTQCAGHGRRPSAPFFIP